MQRQVKRAQQLIRAAAKTGSTVPAREAVAILQELGEESPDDLLEEAVGHVVTGIEDGRGSTYAAAIKPLDDLLRTDADRAATAKPEPRRKARKPRPRKKGKKRR